MANRPPVRPLGRPFVHAMMDDQLLEAVGLPRPHPTYPNGYTIEELGVR
jgi:hypothetical protein